MRNRFLALALLFALSVALGAAGASAHELFRPRISLEQRADELSRLTREQRRITIKLLMRTRELSAAELSELQLMVYSGMPKGEAFDEITWNIELDHSDTE